MFPLTEAIRIENKQLQHIELHNNRLNNARKKLFGLKEKIDLENFITISPEITDDRYKCRVVIDGEMINVEITPYIQREIKTLKVTHCNTIDYSYKTTNRDVLNSLYEKSENCDDIIIIKKGFVTDSWTANILLYDGIRWVTPDTPLLKGIQREYLLNKKLITEERIPISDLLKYKKIKLINAMIDFEHSPEIEIPDNISF